VPNVFTMASRSGISCIMCRPAVPSLSGILQWRLAMASCKPLEEGAAGLHKMRKHAMRVKCLYNGGSKWHLAMASCKPLEEGAAGLRIMRKHVMQVISLRNGALRELIEKGKQACT
jgi:hypothetical protein